MSGDPSKARMVLKKRWVGVLVSVCVPGFGLVRAGLITRGIVWFLTLQIISVFVALFAIWRSVPFWGVVLSMVIAVGCQIAMLVDSFRPGRLSPSVWVVFIVALLAIIFVPSAPHLFAHAFIIPTGGMEPTLRGQFHGIADHIIADRISYRFSPSKRGDLVVFRTTGIADIHANTFFAQRLVGLPGEKIEIKEGHVIVDGRQLDESNGLSNVTYTTAPARSFMTDATVYEVPQNAYFMLGDNSPNSFDSRYWG